MGKHRKSEIRSHAFVRSANAGFGALFERNDNLQDIAEWEWQMVSLRDNTHSLAQQTSQTDREFIILPSRYPYHALYKKLTRQCKKVMMFGHHSGESHERIRQIPQHEDYEKTNQFSSVHAIVMFFAACSLKIPKDF